MMQQLVLELAPAPAPILENFFPGPNAAAVAAVREALGGGERVVYLWGEPGSGRTHLLRAAAASARARGLGALYSGVPHTELSLLDGCGALAVDDVDRLDVGAQAALFDAFNPILQTGLPVCRGGSGREPRIARRPANPPRFRAFAAHASADRRRKGRRPSMPCGAAGPAAAPDIIGYVLTHCRRDMGPDRAAGRAGPVFA